MENYDEKDLLTLIDMGVKMAVKDLKKAVVCPKGSRFITAGLEIGFLGLVFLIPAAIISFMLNLFQLIFIDWIAKMVMFPVFIIIGISLLAIVFGMIMSVLEWMGEVLSNTDL